MIPNRRITLVGLRHTDHTPFALVIRTERPTLRSVYSRPGIPRACTLEVTTRVARRSRPSLAEHVVSAIVVAALTLWFLALSGCRAWPDEPPDNYSISDEFTAAEANTIRSAVADWCDATGHCPVEALWAERGRFELVDHIDMRIECPVGVPCQVSAYNDSDVVHVARDRHHPYDLALLSRHRGAGHRGVARARSRGFRGRADPADANPVHARDADHRRSAGAGGNRVRSATGVLSDRYHHDRSSRRRACRARLPILGDESAMKIEVGSEVMLKSGGPRMTTVQTLRTDGGVMCVWYSDGKQGFVRDIFPPEALKRLPEAAE